MYAILYKAEVLFCLKRKPWRKRGTSLKKQMEYLVAVSIALVLPESGAFMLRGAWDGILRVDEHMLSGEK